MRRRARLRAAALCGAAVMGFTAHAPAQGAGDRIQGELHVALRGPGAAPFGIASAFVTGTGFAYNLGRMMQDLELQRVPGTPAADENYRADVRFRLKPDGQNRWVLDELEIEYEYSGRTRISGPDGPEVWDRMNDAGRVRFVDGSWSGRPGWQPSREPAVELQLFEAPNADRCDEGRASGLIDRLRLAASGSDRVTCYRLAISVLHPMRPTGESAIESPIGGVRVTARDGTLRFSGQPLDVPRLPLELFPDRAQAAQAKQDLADFFTEIIGTFGGQPVPRAHIDPDTVLDVRAQMAEVYEGLDQLMEWVAGGLPEVEADIDASWTTVLTGVLEDDLILEHDTFTILTGAQAYEQVRVPFYAIRADAGGPYVVERGQILELDGSGSEGRDLHYEWTFAPGDCPAEAMPNAEAQKEGEQAAAVFLCSMDVTLTVTDVSGRTHRETTRADVTGRDWTTAVTHRSNWSEPGWWSSSSPPTGSAGPPPSDPAAPRECLRYDTFKMGENWCAGSHPAGVARSAESLGVIHPHGQLTNWLGRGYRIDRLTDPGGPFDGWYYVSSADDISIEREGIFNDYLRPDGPPPYGAEENFYQYNRRMGVDVDALLRGLERHEGMGTPGQARSGHTQIFVAELEEHDPRRAIEVLFRSDRAALERAANAELNRINQHLATASADPINEANWYGRYWVFDPGRRVWCLTPADRL